MRIAGLALLILCWGVPLVTAQTPVTGPAISEEVGPVQKAGTARGFLGVERLLRNGPTGASATKASVLTAVEFDPSHDFPDLRAAIDIAVTIEAKAEAWGVAKGNESEVQGRSRTGVVIDTLGELFAPKSLATDFVHLGSKENLLIWGTGVAAGGLAYGLGADAAAFDYFSAEERLPGDVTGVLDTIGSSQVLYPAVIATYFLGRALGHPEVRNTGAKLTQGLLLTGVIVTVTKKLTTRMRPDQRSDSSLPSGHTADSFTIATILQNDYGWKVGVPAYALASLMGVSRLDANRHYLSDVIVGAAIGVAVGHTVGGRLERQGIQVGFIGAPYGGVGIGVAMDISVVAGHFAAR